MACSWASSSFFGCTPTPGLDIANNGLAALVDVNVFHCDFLLSLAPVLVEGFHGQRIGPGELIGEGNFQSFARFFPTR